MRIMTLMLCIAIASSAAGKGAAEPRTPSPGTLARRAAVLADAERDWRNVDRGIESALLTGDRAAMLHRLSRAETALLNRNAALNAYNRELIRQTTSLLTEIERGATHHEAAFGAMRIAADRARRQAADLDATIERLQSRLDALPEDGTPEEQASREQLEASIRASVALRDHLRNQASEYSAAESLTPADDRGPAISHLRGLVRALQREIEYCENESGLWADYYDGLREHVQSAPGRPRKRKEK